MIRRFSKIVFSAILAISLTACGSSSEPSNSATGTKDGSPTESAAKQEATIKYAFWGDPNTKDLHLKVIDAFMERNPNIKVEPVHVTTPSEYVTKMQTTFAGGTAPDVLNFNNSDTITFADMGVLEPLTSWVKRDWDQDNLGDNLERLMKAFEYNGEQYALPRNASGRTIFYNKKLFDEAGVKYPDSSWTWETLIEEGKKLTKDDPDPNKRTYAIGIEVENFNFHPNFVWQAGGDYFSEDDKKLMLNSPEGREGLQFIHDLIYKHQISPNPSIYTNSHPRDMWMAGKLAMWIDAGSFIVNAKKIEGFEWDVALLPMGPKNRDSLINPSGLVIPKSSENKEAAWELVKFINGPIAQEILVSTGFSAPVRKSILNDETKFLPPDQFKINREVALEAYAEHGRVRHSHPKFTQADSIMKKKLQLYFLNQMDMDTMMSQLENEINPILSK